MFEDNLRTENKMDEIRRKLRERKMPKVSAGPQCMTDTALPAIVPKVKCIKSAVFNSFLDDNFAADKRPETTLTSAEVTSSKQSFSFSVKIRSHTDDVDNYNAKTTVETSTNRASRSTAVQKVWQKTGPS